MKKSTKLQAWTLLAYVLFLIFYVVAFSSCEKDNIEPIQPNPAPVADSVKVNLYLKNAEFVYYNIHDRPYRSLNGSFDTTFMAVPGWTVYLSGESKYIWMEARITLNDSIVDEQYLYNSNHPDVFFINILAEVK